MGCHTWFHKKVNPQPTREDKISQFIEKASERIRRLEKALSNNGFGWMDEDPWFPYGSRDSVERIVDEYKWAIDNADHYDDYSNIKSAEDEMRQVKRYSRQSRILMLHMLISLERAAAAFRSLRRRGVKIVLGYRLPA